MKPYIAIILVLVLCGCSSKYVVTFDSNPQGASLVCSGQNWGYTPKKLNYDESVKKRTTINVSNCSANWISGVKQSYPSNLKVFPSGGTIITLDRPSGDGYAQDAEFALKVRQMQAAEAAAAQQRRTADAAEQKNYNYNNQPSSGYIFTPSAPIYYQRY